MFCRKVNGKNLSLYAMKEIGDIKARERDLLAAVIPVRVFFFKFSSGA